MKMILIENGMKNHSEQPGKLSPGGDNSWASVQSHWFVGKRLWVSLLFAKLLTEGGWRSSKWDTTC